MSEAKKYDDYLNRETFLRTGEEMLSMTNYKNIHNVDFTSAKYWLVNYHFNNMIPEPVDDLDALVNAQEFHGDQVVFKTEYMNDEAGVFEHLNLSDSEYWLTTHSCEDPVPVDNLDQAYELITKRGELLRWQLWQDQSLSIT